MSYNKTGRELMTPDELRVMNNKNCILFIRGLYPFFATKYNLKKHPNYRLSGDASDDNIFDVRKAFRTGRSAEMPRAQSRAMRIMKEAERADAREAERQYHINARPVQPRSARGRELGRIRPLEEDFPVLKQVSDPEAMTPDQKAQFEREAAGLKVRTVVNKAPDINQDAYQQEQLDMFEVFNSYHGLPGDEEDYAAHEAADNVREEE